MTAIGSIVVHFVIALHCVGFSMGLVQPQSKPPHVHTANPDETATSSSSTLESSSSPASLSRRTLGRVAAASLSSLAITGHGYAARADIVDALNAPIGTPFNDLKNEVFENSATFRAIPQEATVKRKKDWAPPRLISDLGVTRIGTDAVLPLPNALPFTGRDTLYPAAFVGDWVVGATLQQTIFPFGPDFVPSPSLINGTPNSPLEKVGDSTVYVLRYLPTSSNGDIFGVADRAYNLVASRRAYDSGVVAGSVEWDPQKDANKLSYQLPDNSAVSVVLTSRKTEDLSRTLKPEFRVFACAERSRVMTATATTQGDAGTKPNVLEDDCEVITEFREITRDTIKATARVAVYLLPNQGGTLWSKVKGKAVALYDYELLMKRA